jgi:cyclopropane-fatty-acyl-phospholipid synthase
MSRSEQKAREILTTAGIVPNGPNPWDPQIKNNKVFDRIMAGGSLALGESYMDGWWEVQDMSGFFDRVLSAKLNKKIPVSFEMLWYFIRARFINLQDRIGATEVAHKHYNLGNDLYMSFLDPYNQYTCGYFKDTEDLNVAQEKKLDLICKKLQLKPTDKVLDIGCGWGGFAKYAAEHYGCHVTGISISDEQIKYAAEACKGLPVTILKKDYRDIEGTFDKVLICGMIEHVGFKNYNVIMKAIHRVLADDGLFLLHTIGVPKTVYSVDAWFNKYIFPNGHLPSIAQISSSVENVFIVEDWHNFGADYDKTLMAWWKNFDRNWSSLKDKYGERFYRMWRYYLLSMAGSFRSRVSNQLWQIVLSKNGVRGGYTTVR